MPRPRRLFIVAGTTSTSGSPTEIEPDDAQQIPFASRGVRGRARRGALRGQELDQKGDLIVDRQDSAFLTTERVALHAQKFGEISLAKSQRPSQPAKFVPGIAPIVAEIHRSNTGTAIMPTMFITLRRRASRRWRPWGSPQATRRHGYIIVADRFVGEVPLT